MPRILDGNVVNVSRIPQEVSSEPLSDAHVNTAYEVIRNNNNYSMIVPMNHFMNSPVHNNRNKRQMAHYQSPRENAHSPSNLIMTYSPPSPMPPAETIGQEKQAGSLLSGAPVNERKKTVFQTIRAAMTLGNFLFMLGTMVIFAIPLAVIVTLMIVNTPTSPTTASTTSTTIGVNLATQCYTYTSIATDITRVYPYYTGSCNINTDSYSAGWYRFQSTAGATRLLTTPFNSSCYCGGYYGGWWNGTLPMTVGLTNTGNVCYAYGGASCYSSSTPISVTNCSGYYVNYLVTAPSLGRYCTTTN